MAHACSSPLAFWMLDDISRSLPGSKLGISANEAQLAAARTLYEARFSCLDQSKATSIEERSKSGGKHSANQRRHCRHALC